MNTMKRVTVQYQYFDDSVCNRCIDSERKLRVVIGAFTSRCRNVRVELVKQKLSPDDIEKSPTILVEGADIETIANPSSSPQISSCNECSCLTGHDVSCRSYGNNNVLSSSKILYGLVTHICDTKHPFSDPCVC